MLVAPGTYVEQLDLLGKSITVRSEGGAAVTTIDSQGMASLSGPVPAPVVRMVGGEGPLTVLEGFTITGGNSTTTAASGVYCPGRTPRIRFCVITGNRSGADGAGVRGDAWLEGCTISNNATATFGRGGGVAGRPTIEDCVIVGNSAGSAGGGLWADATCSVSDTVIDSNTVLGTLDGYGGGGVYGPAHLTRCIVVNNVADHFTGGGVPNQLGSGLQQVGNVSRCTVAFNRVGNPPAIGPDPAGGVYGSGPIVNSILFGNDAADVLPFSMAPITYSLVGTGFPGAGNLTGDPLFVDAAGGDYALQPTSPCIDAGDPASPLDPDGTIVEMGAIPFPQATATFAIENGSGVNPASFQTQVAPVLGTTWTATIDGSLHAMSPPPSYAIVYGVLPSGAPLATPFGELLIAPAAPVVELAVFLTGGPASISIPVPVGLEFSGLAVHLQAVAGGVSFELSNAIELVLGM